MLNNYGLLCLEMAKMFWPIFQPILNNKHIYLDALNGKRQRAKSTVFQLFYDVHQLANKPKSLL